MKTINRFFLLVFSMLLLNVASAQDIPRWNLQTIKDSIAGIQQPTIINFWATWCKPCIEELPDFQEMAKKYESEGVRLILVSLDMMDHYPGKIRQFAKKHKITAPIVFLDETDADVFCPAVDPSWSGSIPATLFLNNKTGYRKFLEEQLSKDELEREIGAMLEK